MPRCQFILEDGSHCDLTAVSDNLCLKHLRGDNGGLAREVIAKRISAYAGAAAAVLKLAEEIFKIVGPHIKMQGRGDVDLDYIREQAQFVIDIATGSEEITTLDAVRDIYIVMEQEMEALIRQLSARAIASEERQPREEARS